MSFFVPVLSILSLSAVLFVSADAQVSGRFLTVDQVSEPAPALKDNKPQGSTITPLKSTAARITAHGSMVYVTMNAPAKQDAVLEVFSLSGVIVESYKLEAGKRKFAFKCDISQAGSYYAVLRENEKSGATIAPVSLRHFAGKN